MTETSWTTPSDIRAWLARQWDRGRLLTSVLEQDRFPLRVPFKVPTSRELGTQYDDARAWVAAIQALPRVRLEARRINHRQLGAQDIPAKIWIDTVDDAAALIGRSGDLSRFRLLVEQTSDTLPAAVPLLAKRPLDVLHAAEEWTTLMTLAQWMLDHPRPSVHVRQIDLPGVHTKFVEEHRQLLAALLECVLQPEAIDTTARTTDIARRFRFLLKPRLVRFRTLDPQWRLTAFDVDGQYLLTAADFGRVPPPGRVVITENEINFLALPPLPDAIAVFGAGSGLEHLADAPWLTSCPVYYWGDIDTHGFWILDQLRAVVPHAASLLMDRHTLMEHRELWGTEQSPHRRDLDRLTTDERDIYDDLRDNRIGPKIRLEQERIRFSAVQRALQAIQ
ncbi:MAG TPA: Wadjet anti-phage system protein JetD domain-containing protein [Actinomycetes bacterium]|nr:Wadjet anti-phage system protein JetD domain-containing protein [Actinomycetes bacterium]